MHVLAEISGSPGGASVRVVRRLDGRLDYEYAPFNDEFGYAVWLPLPVDSLRDVDLNTVALRDVIRSIEELFALGFEC